MTTKKYILTFAIFALLLVLTVFLFFSGLFIKEQNEFAFYVFVACSSLCFILAIVYIAVNYKKLIDFEIGIINKKVADLDFSIFNISISEDDLIDKLIERGYTIARNIFCREFEDDGGDASMVYRYFVTLSEVNEFVDIQAILQDFSKGATSYNIGFIFIDGNVEENLEIIKRYIKATISDVKAHPFKYKNFFIPIAITNDRIYYIKQPGIFTNAYGAGAAEGVRIIRGK